jgi:hypothetical protein
MIKRERKKVRKKGPTNFLIKYLSNILKKYNGGEFLCAWGEGSTTTKLIIP